MRVRSRTWGGRAWFEFASSRIPLARRLLLTAASLISGLAALSGCQVFDPIEKVDFCSGRATVAATCPQCLRPPYAPECSQCQGSAPDDACSHDTGTAANSATGMAANGGGNSGAGASATGTSSGNSGQAAASGSQGTPGPSGAQGGQAGQAGQGPSGGPQGGQGANGQPGSGISGAGTPAKLPGCDSDADCSGSTPGCEPVSRTCFPCIENKHCTDGLVCDTPRHQCVPCVGPGDCKNSQVCEIDTRSCFDCLNNADCHNGELDTCSAQRSCVDCENGVGCNDPSKPACIGQTCLQCSNDTQCRAPEPRCSNDNKCVGCLAEADCISNTAAPHCDVTNQACVACLTDHDCPDPSASHCESNMCVPCSAAGQCDQVTGKTLCDTTNSVCVQCLVDKDCGSKACIQTTKTCSTIDYMSLPKCAACATDNECSVGNLCVLVDYTPTGGATHSAYYCLSANVPHCSALPAYDRTVHVPSIDGPAGDFCFPPANTSCEAVNDAGLKTCMVARDCGLKLGDGVCNIVGTATTGICSYNCRNPNDCKTMNCTTNLICQ
jgi:hypothetical protein